tara:strand:+ start:50 stop:490 length:441 start_codon:yes stop_codon:yes gene_type:complete
MIKANVILENSDWEKKIKNPKKYIQKKLNILSKMSKNKKKILKFTLLLTNDKKMKNLNKKFRKKNKSTDVLSFPFNDKYSNNSYIGDIAVSYEIINQRSKQTNFNIEFDKMWIHGYLHLIGHDHKNIKDFKKMSKKENLILNNLNK